MQVNRRRPPALATMAIEAGDGAGAVARLRALLAGPLKPADRTRSLTLLGDALEKTGDTDAAFDSFRAAQANFRASYAPMLAPGPDRPSHRAFIEPDRGAGHRARAGAAGRGHGAGGGGRGMCFLLGYPRSGTTLVENILASAPGVVALEERDTMADSDEALVANDGTMPPLDALDPALLARLRAAYWRRVAALGADVAGKTFVDMNPFNGIKLPVIARLFPQARIVIMRRDPRDVLLSCFRINFHAQPGGVGVQRSGGGGAAL